MSEDEDLTRELYPEIVEAGSFREAFRRQLAAISSPLAEYLVHYDQLPIQHVRLELQPRFSQIYTAAQERLFMPDFWDHGVCVANAKSGDLEGIALAVDRWVTGEVLSIFDLAKQFPFVEPEARARSHENGTEVDDRWSAYLEGGGLRSLHEDLPELVRVASQEPKLRQLFPYTSMRSLCFSRCTGYPFTRDTPWFTPVGDRRFQLHGVSKADDGRPPEGSAEEVVRRAAESIPDTVGPAWIGTADDEA